MILGLEDRFRPVDLPLPLDVDVLRTIHHDLGDTVVREKGLQRAEPQNLGHDLLEELLPLRAAENHALLSQDILVHAADRAADLVGMDDVQRRIQLGDQAILDARFQVLVGSLHR